MKNKYDGEKGRKVRVSQSLYVYKFIINESYLHGNTIIWKYKNMNK